MWYFTVPAAVVPSLVLMWYFHTRDKFPEPAKVIWATFGWGVFIVIPVLMVAVPLDGVSEAIANPYVKGFARAFLEAAIPEETFKMLVVLLYCARHSAFDEPMDGLVYGVAASLGFATLENILYVSSGGLSVAVARAFTAVPGHAMLGAIMGFYIGQAQFNPEQRKSLLWRAWFIPVLFHGLYDFPLLALREGVPMEVLMVGLALLVLAIEWRWAVQLARQVRALQEAKVTLGDKA